MNQSFWIRIYFLKKIFPLQQSNSFLFFIKKAFKNVISVGLLSKIRNKYFPHIYHEAPLLVADLQCVAFFLTRAVYTK